MAAAGRPPSVRALLAAVAALPPPPGRPVVVALDGRSCTGKSTLATALRLRTDLQGDDFYRASLPGLIRVDRDAMSDVAVTDAVVEWARLRTVALGPLRRGQPAAFRPYDWEADDGRLGPVRRLAPSGLVLVEGSYAARPELADLVDRAVLVRWSRGCGPSATPRAGGTRTGRASGSAASSTTSAWSRPPTSFDLASRARRAERQLGSGRRTGIRR